MTSRSDPKRAVWSEQTIAEFRSRVLDFFGRFGRDLPWRRSSDPYAILVSEFMLQQTRVGTVLPYFLRWMERFPTLQALAEASREEVLTVWAGLGYYSRAGNLHGAVREVVAEYEGRLPEDPETLEALPGVGPYTAGAVASIAFGIPAPAVDGNVRRVYARLLDDPRPSLGEVRRWAGAVVDPVQPGEFNQGLMELGSLVCTPRAPSCPDCPVHDFCAASRSGTQDVRPAPGDRRRVRRSREAVAVLVRRGEEDGQTLLRRRPEGGLLGGMWELPGREVEGTREPRAVATELAGELLGALGGSEAGPPSGSPVAMPPLDHAFTHRAVRYLPFIFLVSEQIVVDGTQELRWVARGGETGLPLPAAQRRLMSRIGSLAEFS